MERAPCFLSQLHQYRSALKVINNEQDGDCFPRVDCYARVDCVDIADGRLGRRRANPLSP
jgi:hypothetical protein